jgi:hypothetical protein
MCGRRGRLGLDPTHDGEAVMNGAPGDASYSIYVFHWFAMPLVRHIEQMHRLVAIRSAASTAILGVVLSVSGGYRMLSLG